jgi:hypothetical protein
VEGVLLLASPPAVDTPSGCDIRTAGLSSNFRLCWAIAGATIAVFFDEVRGLERLLLLVGDAGNDFCCRANLQP